MKMIKSFRKYRMFLLFIIDTIVILIAYFMSCFLMTQNFLLSINIEPLKNTVIISVLAYQLFFQLFDVYRNITRYETGKDYLVYMICCVFATILVIAFKYVTILQTLGNKAIVLAGLLTAVGIVSYRVLIRFILISQNPEKNQISNIQRKNLLIIGAGNAARDIIKTIKQAMPYEYNVIGLIDDNINKYQYTISGKRILGNRYRIEEMCERYNVNQIFFTISNIDNENKKEILNICQKTGAKVRILSSTKDMIKNKNTFQNLRDINIEDILGRDIIKLDNKNIQQLIANQTILVTGGGGSIGSELCRQIADYKPKQLIMFDIYENNLYDIELELKAKYNKIDIQAIIGSVRDKNKLNQVFEKYKPYLVFHAAAHKHVPLMEHSPLEAIKNNVIGTNNVVNCADKYNVRKFILISSDKAVNPTNIMGATKRLCEMIVQAKNQVSKTEYVAVRFGNVLESNGSVVPLFKKQILNGGPVTITHKDITRFFMTIPEAVGLILQATTYAKGGEIFVLDMGEPVKIYDLAITLIKLSGLEPNVDIPIEIIGLRPGEKLYEELLMKEERLETTKHEKIFIGEPLGATINEVKNKIIILENLVANENSSIETIKQTIKKLVPTYMYTSSNEINEKVNKSNIKISKKIKKFENLTRVKKAVI